MEFKFHFGSLRSIGSIFRKTVAQYDVSVSGGKLRLLVKGSTAAPEYFLRMSSFGTYITTDLSRDDMLRLADALTEAAEFGLPELTVTDSE